MKDKKNFIAVKESFVCKNCGAENNSLPSGTRNHCHKCLHSLHVDAEIPGDRSSICKGIMKPINAFQKDGEWVLEQKCIKCGKVWKNRLSNDDDTEALAKIFEEKTKHAEGN